MASDAAMKIETCLYFHAENEFFFRWKSTRREATSGGAGDCDVIDRRNGCHRDGVRIVGMHHVGPHAVQHARELPPGLEIQFVCGCERDELESLGGALAKLAARVPDEQRTLADLEQAHHRQQHLILPAAP